MPSILPLLAIAGAAALALSSKSSAASGGTSPLPTNADSKYDANLPAILESTVDQELLNDSDPDSLNRFADSLEAQGYPIAAEALRARARALSKEVPEPPPNIQPAPPPPVVTPPAPPVVVTPGTVVVAPPLTITPSTGSEFGVDATPWDSSWDIPNLSYAGGFRGSHAQASAIQKALNLWAMAVQFDPDAQTGFYPLANDGDYGQMTASLAAAFQHWVNATGAADYATLGMSLDTALREDGIAGPKTIAWLQPWAKTSGPIPAS